MEEKQLNINELIKVEALPKIMYQLEIIGKQVDKALKGIDTMECTELNKQEVKTRKQEITKFKNLMEDRRKEIKSQVMAKYDEFNKKYEEEVKDKLVNAENILKEKYIKIEDEQKAKIKQEVREFSNQHIIAHNLQGIMQFEDINLNITLSASIKSLKETARAFIESKANDIKLIRMEEYKDEILLEYKKSLDFVNAKTIVIERHKQLEQMQEKAKELDEKIVEEQKAQEKIEKIVEDEIVLPKEEEEKSYYEFKIFATNTQAKELLNWLKERGIKYE